MVIKQEAVSLSRSSSCCLSSSTHFISSSPNFSRSSSSHLHLSHSPPQPLQVFTNHHNHNHNHTPNYHNHIISPAPLSLSRVTKTRLRFSAFLRSLLHFLSFPTSTLAPPPTCRWLTIPNRMLSLSSSTPLGRKVVGTLFGHRKGHVSFAVQDDPRADPAFLVELAISTSALVREMSSGLVRIALECEKPHNTASRGKHATKLFVEPQWTMYCNGRKCGYANTRACAEFDWYVLSTIQSVSVGAGVIPLVENRTGSGSEGELLYMRAKFERVVGSRDSEAFYMLNPDGNGGPELGIFLLRL